LSGSAEYCWRLCSAANTDSVPNKEGTCGVLDEEGTSADKDAGTIDRSNAG